jgi:hypothetical protein
MCVLVLNVLCVYAECFVCICPHSYQDLFAAINKVEPRNAVIYYRMARAFGRLAGSDSSLLTVTCMMAERAVQLKPEHAPYVSGVTSPLKRVTHQWTSLTHLRTEETHHLFYAPPSVPPSLVIALALNLSDRRLT